MSIAFLFPGQGEQSKEMGLEVLTYYSEYNYMIEQAQLVSGIDVMEVISSGEESQIYDPHISSVLVFLISAVYSKILRDHGVSPQAVAGYSVGQFAALFNAGVVDFENCLKMVHERGLLLKAHGSKSRSGMIGVIGLTAESLSHVLDRFKEARITNYSTPTNLSLCYPLEQEQELMSAIQDIDPIKVVALPVGGGWHSHFMKEAGDEFQAYLRNFKMSAPNRHFYDNYTGDLNLSAESIKKNLYYHMFSPVLWYQTIRRLKELEISAYVEVGHGHQLTKFSQLINRRTKVYSTSGLEEIQQVIKELGSQN